MAGYIGSKASVVSSGAERKKTFTITGATTSLTGLNYTVGKVHVFQNGVRLVDGTDYTATNGTTITLTVAAQSGDNVVVISQADFQVSGAVSTSGDTMTGNLVVSAATPNIDVSATGTGVASQDFLTNSNAARTTIGVERSGGGGLFVGSSPYAAVFGSAGANPTQIASNNTVRMTVDTAGKVGVGIPTPTSILTVKGSGSNGTIKVVPAAINAEASIGFYQDTTGENQTSRWVAGVGGWGQTNQFVIGTESTPKLQIDTPGRVTKPYQPGFYAYSTGFSKSTGWQNISQYMTNIGHNIGNHYTSTGGNTGRFTAPVTGRYVFHVGGWSSHNGGTNCQRYMYSIFVNGSNIGNGAGGNYSDGDSPMENGSFIVQLTAGQWVQVNAFSSVACTYGSSTHHFHWSGYLLG